MKAEDWAALLKLVAAFVPGKIWKAFTRDIWVVSEYEGLARDNGYWFYRYLREEHPEVKAYYPLSSKSPDIAAIKALGNHVEFGSFKHYCLFWAAMIYAGTTKCYGFPYRRICEDLVQWGLHGFKYAFLNHGFTRGYSSIVDAAETRYDLLVTCGESDSRIIVEENGQSPDVVKCLGFARHDNLDNELLNARQILVMPTWRKWLDVRNDISEVSAEEVVSRFLESDYYRAYSELLNDASLVAFLERNDLTLVFYLHEYAQPYSRYFTTSSKRVVIGTSDRYNIQNLLKESAILVTDYSSVSYDFAYMHKPVVYYQFDVEDFESRQYAPGDSYSYERDGFGKIVFDKSSLIDEIKSSYEVDFTIGEKYRERVDRFFKFHDRNNCKRVFKAVEELLR